MEVGSITGLTTGAGLGVGVAVAVGYAVGVGVAVAVGYAVGVGVAATGIRFGLFGAWATVGVAEGKIIEVGDGVGCTAERDCGRGTAMSGVGV